MTAIEYEMKMTAEVPASLVVDGIEGFLDDWIERTIAGVTHHLEYGGYKEGDYAWDIDVQLDCDGTCVIYSYIDEDPYDLIHANITDLMTELPKAAKDLDDYIQNGFKEE